MFTLDEIQLLMDALDALKSKQSMDIMFGGMLGAMVAGSKEQSGEVVSEMRRDLEAIEQNKTLEKRIILLKAKLIGFEDGAAVNDVANWMMK